MRELWETHDALVVVAALVLLGGGAVLAGHAECPAMKRHQADGLSVDVPAAWLREPREGGVQFRGEDAVTRLEVRSLPRAEPSVGVDGMLELERGQTYGQMYRRLGSERRKIRGKEWLRTEFVYACKPTPDHAPRIADAIEIAYPADAEVASSRVWVVTLHGSEERVRELEPWVLGTAEVSP
ncbi:MAG TPA: hypothetical protein VKE22_12080 [Haliangiales bacterium]|nr:hypothetical protein [Haliangiales bacterium]